LTAPWFVILFYIFLYRSPIPLYDNKKGHVAERFYCRMNPAFIWIEFLTWFSLSKNKPGVVFLYQLQDIGADGMHS